jgi:hypothetical protein
MADTLEWPDLLPGVEYRPAYWATRRRERRLPTLDLLPKPPEGIVIHSGQDGPGTAEWAWRKEARYWAQLAWWAARGRYVHTDTLRAWAPHGGPYNSRTIGIELPGPAAENPRPAGHREATVALVRLLVAALPSIRWITGHQFIQSTKRDPGPGVTADWWDGLGLEVHWTWVGSGLLVARR